MTDRIRKIAIEADAWCDKYYFGDKFYDIEWEKKFAELIVQEAAAFVSGAAEVYNQAEQDACVRASRGLKKYFGVEE